MKTLRLFISSPGDVGRERHATAEVIRRLQSEFAEHVTLDPYFWEWEPVDFSKDYQANIPSTADFDIVICILWSRLGSRLSDQHKLPPDYTRPASSGTEYELLQALHGQQQHPDCLPDLLVWKNDSPPPPASAPPLSREEEDERIRQRRALQDFLTSVTRDATTGSFIAALNSYTYLDEFEDMMDKKLRKLIEKHIGQRSVKPKPQWQGSPFRDLDVFEFEHAPIFFGRSRAVGEVVRLLQSTLSKPQPCHFALILGASGSGKSSLARAGVLPLLTRPGVIEGIGLWRCAIVRPSDDSADLFQALASALLNTDRKIEDKKIGSDFSVSNFSVANHQPPALPELADPESSDAQNSLAAELRAHPQTVAIRVKDQLSAVAKAHQTQQRHTLEAQIATLTQEGRQADAALKQQTLQSLQEPKARLVLLLDQMEELFTLNYAPEQLRAFLETIAVLARSGRVFVIGTLRSDFYPRYQEQPTLVALARDGARFDLLPPTPDEISQIIRRPASFAALQFEPHPTTAEHTLADTLRDEALADTEALPLLEHVLNRLYQAQLPRADGRLTFADYEEICGIDVDPKTGVKTSRGVGGALGKHAEDIFTGQNLKPTDPPPPWTEETFRAVFRCLVTFGKGEGDTDVPNRRAFTYQDLIQSDPAAQALVDTFIHERLLIADTDAQSQAIVRLSHEALLTRWPRLAKWLQTAPVRDLMSQRRRLESSLRQWQEQNHTPDCYLQPGFELEEGKQLLEKHEATLKPEEQEFITASVAFHAEREKKALKRRKQVVAVLTTLTCLALIAGLVAWNQAVLANKASRQSQAEKVKADLAAAKEKAANESNLRTLHEASMADYAVAVQRIEKDNKWHEGVAHLARSLKWEPDNSLAATRLYGTLALHTLEKQIWPRQVLKHKASVLSAEFSPDGTRIVTASHDRTAQVWDAVSGKPLGEPLRHKEEVFRARFSPDGARIITESVDNTVHVWEAASGKHVGDPLHHEDDVNSMQFSPDGTRILTASGDFLLGNPGEARIWDAASGKPLGEPLRHEKIVWSAKFSQDGAHIVTASGDNSAKVWDAASGKPLGEPLCHESVVFTAEFSSDGTRIVTASNDRTARLWDAVSGKPLCEPLRHEDGVCMAQFSPDGTRIVTASRDKTARVWDAASGKPLGEALRHAESVNSAQFSADGMRIVTVNEDQTARVWDAASGKPLGEPLRHEGIVWSAQFSPDGARIVTASGDNSAKLWDAASGKPLGEPLRLKGIVTSAQFSPDTTRIVTTSDEPEHFGTTGEVRVWDAATRKPLGVALRHEGRVVSAEFSPDSSRIVTASYDKTARVWDAASGKPLGEPLRHESVVFSAQFSPDGVRIVTMSDDKTARVWDAASGKPLGEPLRHEESMHSVQFSPDGSHIVTASGSFLDLKGEVRVWDSVSGKPLGEPLRHEECVNSAQFSPDGSRIVTASYDKTAQVWDAASGKPLGEPLRHEIPVDIAQFSSDGARIVTVDGHMSVRVWDAASGKLLFEPLRHDGHVNSLKFSPDGACIVIASHGSTVWVWDVKAMLQAHAHVPVPEWMSRRARAVAGLDFDANGQMQTLTSEKRRDALLAPVPPNDPWSGLARWLALPANERTLTPDSKFTCREIAERERDSGHKEGLESALRYDPTVPLARLLLAGVLLLEEEEKKPEERDPSLPQRAAFLCDYDLKRLPDVAALWIRAAKSLAEQKDFKRSLQAAEKALKLDPLNAEAKKALEAAQQANSGR